VRVTETFHRFGTVRGEWDEKSTHQH
jgi:hypothetical protein